MTLKGRTFAGIGYEGPFPLVPVQYFAGITAGDSIEATAIAEDGKCPVYGGNGIRGYTDGFNNQHDRVVVGRQGALCGNVHLAKGPFWATEHALVVDPVPNVHIAWLKYALEAANLQRLSTAAAQPGITRTQVEQEQLPLPPVGCQIALSAYLDRETAEIDAMGADLDRLLALLPERRSAVGSSLHTRGYESVQVKWLLDEVDCRAGDSATVLPLLSVSIHDGVQLRNESAGRRRASGDLSNYKVAAEEQLILNRMRAFQGGLGVAPTAGLVSPDYSVLGTRPELEPWWAGYVMRSPEFVDDMSRALRGIGSADQGNVRTPRINVRDLLDLEIPLPPLEEQRRIVERLETETARIDAMIADAQKLKALLAERRSALITDVITGRKEVA